MGEVRVGNVLYIWKIISETTLINKVSVVVINSIIKNVVVAKNTIDNVILDIYLERVEDVINRNLL